MPYNSNNGGGGGPWGGGGGSGGGGGKGPWGGGGNNGGGGGGGGNQQGPDLDDLIRKGRDQLRVVLGGKGGGPTNGTGGGGGGSSDAGKMLPSSWVQLAHVLTVEQNLQPLRLSNVVRKPYGNWSIMGQVLD